MTTVMVVEPEVLVRMVICEYLRCCGYKVIEAGSSHEALCVLDSTHPVDVVFAEISGLGTHDGFALARRIRDTQPHIDVILTSGPAGAAAEAAELCDHGVIGKPYHPDEIVHRIQRLRERRRRTDPG